MSRIVETGRELRSIVTRRSMLPRLADRDRAAREDGWTYLFTLYMPAMVRYVERVLGQRRVLSGPDDARDVVQTWFAEALAKGWFDRDAGDIRCFRAYLQTQLRRLAYKEIERRRAKKRDPGRTAPPEALASVAGAGDDAEALDGGFVDVAVERALGELRAHNEDYAEVIADLLRTDGEGSADLAARMGKSPQQLVHLRHRARRRFAVLLHDSLRETVRDEDDFSALMRRLEAHLP